MKKREIIEKDKVEMPVVKYKYVSYLYSEKVFTGDVISIPDVLIEYLDNVELKVFAIIMRHLRRNSCCVIDMETLSRRLKITRASVNHAISRMKNMGIVYYENMGRKRDKRIDFSKIQCLHDFLKEKNAGAPSALRKVMKDKDVSKIPQNIVQLINENYGSRDEAEDEEYD